MPTIVHQAPEPPATRTAVLLPGRLDRPSDYAERGFVDRLARLDPGMEVIAADAHLGYYRRRVIADRLWADVVGPAHEATGEVWLVGVSLGGIGALGLAREHPEAIAGMVLLAPYLGPDELIESIDEAGGPLAWRAGDPEDPIQKIWLWLSREWSAEEGPEIWLGVGTGDRLLPGSRQLARLLDERRTVELPGGHDWEAWKRLFDELIERGAFGAGDGASQPAP